MRVDPGPSSVIGVVYITHADYVVFSIVRGLAAKNGFWIFGQMFRKYHYITIPASVWNCKSQVTSHRNVESTSQVTLT